MAETVSNLDIASFVAGLDRTYRSVLLYAETCLVDGGGLLEGRRMNDDDHDALKRLSEQGFLSYGRIPACLLGTHGFTQSQPTHWVEFTANAWDIAHALRVLRSDQRGPYAMSVFAEVAARKEAA